MRGLKTLIRLHRWQLDETRRKLEDLDAEQVAGLIRVERGGLIAYIRTRDRKRAGDLE